MSVVAWLRRERGNKGMSAAVWLRRDEMSGARLYCCPNPTSCSHNQMFARCTNAANLLVTEPSEDVDFFLDHWGSNIYGKDKYGHYVWMEGVKTIKAKELLERFEDDRMMEIRSVVMETLEIYKGNALSPTQNTIYKHIYVFDLKGIKFGDFGAAVRRVVKNVIIDMGNIFPESVHKVSREHHP